MTSLAGCCWNNKCTWYFPPSFSVTALQELSCIVHDLTELQSKIDRHVFCGPPCILQMGRARLQSGHDFLLLHCSVRSCYMRCTGCQLRIIVWVGDVIAWLLISLLRAMTGPLFQWTLDTIRFDMQTFNVRSITDRAASRSTDF